VITADEGRAAALRFLAARIDTWFEQAFDLTMDEKVQVPGCFVYQYGPTRTSIDDSRVPRTGGNWPVLVDRETGECRLVAGREEYDSLWSRTGTIGDHRS
jgi:hypothetical protein